MPVAYGSAGTRLLVGTAATTWNVPYPASIAQDDLLVLHISSNGGTATTPSGWTEIYRETTLTNPKGGLWIKVASGSESGNLAVTMASSTGNAQMFRYTGVDPTTPQDATAQTYSNSANSNTVIPAITTVTANTLLIYANAGNSGTVTMTAPGTERVDHGALGGTGTKAGALYDEAVAGTGSTGTRTITLSAGRANWGAMIALRPASAGPITATPTGIASAEAFGSPTSVATLTSAPTGIASAETFGTPTSVATLSAVPGGIASAETFGTPTAAYSSYFASPVGISSSETFGTATAQASLVTQPSGISSAETFGTPTEQAVLVAVPAGIGGSEAFGTPTELATLNASPTGITSAEALGSPTEQSTLVAVPAGIPSAEAFGTPTSSTGNQVQPTGIPSAEALGLPTWAGTLTVTPTGIGSAEAFGTPAATAPTAIQPTGIPSAETFGTPTELGNLNAVPTGIPSGEVVNNPVIILTTSYAPGGIISLEAFGTPTELATLTAQVVGIVSSEVFGTPSHLGARTVTPTGISSAEAFGTPAEISTLTSTPTGIPSAEALGSPTAIRMFRFYPAGISSAEQFGIPRSFIGAENLADLLMELTAEAVRWALQGADDRFTLEGQDNRISLSALELYELQDVARRWQLAGIAGEPMIIEIHASAGGQQYVGGTITEKTGKDISAVTITMSLGSESRPGTTWSAPDQSSSGPLNVRNVLMMVGASEATPAGTYAVWVKMQDGPSEQLIMRFPQKVIVK